MFKNSIYIGSNKYEIIDTDFIDVIQCKNSLWDEWTNGFIDLYKSRGLNVAANFAAAIKHFYYWQDHGLPITEKLDPYREDIKKYLLLM
jgi:hypothetical protein